MPDSTDIARGGSQRIGIREAKCMLRRDQNERKPTEESWKRTYPQGTDALTPIREVRRVNGTVLELAGEDPDQSKELFYNILARPGRSAVDGRHGEVSKSVVL